MIIAHEWEGEPHNSPSVKKLYRPDEPLIEYVWVGEDHSSESIKKMNGEEVIRNLIPNPSFELAAPVPYNPNHLVDHSNERSVSGGYSARAFQGWQNEGYNRLGVRWTVHIPVGYIGIRIWVYMPSSNVSTAGRVNFQLGNSGPSWQSGATELDKWQLYEYVVENTQELETSTLYIGFETDGNVEGDEIWFDDAIMVAAETEEEALRKLDEGYFDGDSKHEHGLVTAWNPLSGTDRTFEEIWCQPTPPPPGTHYAWLGEPDESVSVRLDNDGNETAQNLFMLPRDFDVNGSDRRPDVDLSKPGRIEVLTSNYRNAYRWAINNGISYIGDPDFAEGEYDRTYTMSVEVKAHVQHPEGYYHIRFDLRTPVIHHSEPGVIEDTGGEWVQVGTTLTLGADLQGDKSLFNITSGANHTPGDVIEYRNWKLERGSRATPYFDGSTPSDRAHDLWYNTDGVPHEWINGAGWVEIIDERFKPLPDDFLTLPLDLKISGDTPDYQIPNTKVYYDGKWVSLYDYHSS